MRVAYYSPLPPEMSGIADYSALLLPALEQLLDVSVVGPKTRRRPRRIDLHLYHIGNNADAHGWIVDELRRTPGVVVLHEFVLHHLVAGLTLGQGDGDGYLDALQAEAGLIGRSVAHAVIDGLLPPVWEERPQDFPLARPIIELASGLVVHSEYVEGRVRAEGYDRPIWRVPHPAWPKPKALPPPPVETLGSPTVICAGNLNPSKRVPQLLQAFARLRLTHPDALLVLAGAVSPRFALSESPAREHGIVQLDYLEEQELWALIAAADICVNLRWPTMGETSGAALRALSLGKPLVVSDVGWFSELPDSVAVKVPVDEWEVETLARSLVVLAERPDLRERMEEAAHVYVTKEHNLSRVADLYAEAMEEAAGGPPLRAAVLEEVATAAYDVGLERDDPQVRTLGARAREIGLG